jgi:hypothetical protein
MLIGIFVINGFLKNNYFVDALVTVYALVPSPNCINKCLCRSNCFLR